jgi:endonuclease/exonuclease/phosphatase family metal-dependent hydrolase
MILAWTLGCLPDLEPASGSPVPASGSLSALTYNVHGLPPEITGDDTAGRLVAIGPLLPPFDIVGLQEDFDDDNHAALVASVNHPTQVRFSEALADRVYGSGLAVLSHLEEESHFQEHYEDCNGVLDAASDCLASKGFQVVRLALAPGATVDVYNTHLEAGGGSEDHAARTQHVQQLLDSLANRSADRAVIFLADTNLHAGDALDGPLLSQLLEEGGLVDSCAELGCAEPDHIDRILVRDSNEVSLQVSEWEVRLEFVDGEGADLSDHPAIAVDVDWAFDPENNR